MLLILVEVSWRSTRAILVEVSVKVACRSMTATDCGYHHATYPGGNILAVHDSHVGGSICESGLSVHDTHRLRPQIASTGISPC